MNYGLKINILTKNISFYSETELSYIGPVSVSCLEDINMTGIKETKTCLKLGTSPKTLNKFKNDNELFLAKTKYRRCLGSPVFDVSIKFGIVFP